MKCYCGSDRTFSECCQPFITKSALPNTPEQLMRSRYSAFCTNQVDYLVDTHWPVEPNSRYSIQNTIDTTHWLGLRVVATQIDPENDRHGEVEFIAFYKENGIGQLHERSRFKLKDNQWYYLDGQQLPPVKLFRNDRCFCGSTKKFKKCHGQQS